MSEAKLMKCVHIGLRNPVPDKVEMAVVFKNGNNFSEEILWIKNFIGDTPNDLADSLQVWVDALRKVETT